MGVCATVAGVGWPLFRSRRPGTRGLHRVGRSSHALGSKVAMTALHKDRSVAEAAVAQAFGELEHVEEVMSLYRPGSQICRLNREGKLNDPDPYLVEVLRFAEEVSRSSEGAFDVTVQPLWSIHAAAQREGRAPEEKELSEARGRVDWRRVEVSGESVVLHGDGTEITLNGIAQGFAVDAALRAMRSHGVRDALIDTGELGGQRARSRR